MCLYLQPFAFCIIGSCKQATPLISSLELTWYVYTAGSCWQERVGVNLRIIERWGWVSPLFRRTNWPAGLWNVTWELLKLQVWRLLACTGKSWLFKQQSWFLVAVIWALFSISNVATVVLFKERFVRACVLLRLLALLRVDGKSSRGSPSAVEVTKGCFLYFW